jgi:hypothetical protein
MLITSANNVSETLRHFIGLSRASIQFGQYRSKRNTSLHIESTCAIVATKSSAVEESFGPNPNSLVTWRVPKPSECEVAHTVAE